MTKAQLQARITQLEAEVAELKSQVEDLKPGIKNFLKHTAENPMFETDHERKDFMRTIYQLRDADRQLPPSPALTRLHRAHKSLITQLRQLGHFKSNLAAAEFAHNNFHRPV